MKNDTPICSTPLSEWKNAFKVFKTEKSHLQHPYIQFLLKQPKMREYIFIPNDESSQFTSRKKTKAHDKNICALLSELGFTDIDLDDNSGLVDGNPTRMKLGRTLSRKGFTKYADYLKRRNNTSTGKKNHYLVFSINPWDVLHCSINRNWTSCTHPDENYGFPNLVEGCFEHNKECIIAYLIEEEDTKIHKPLGRCFIHPYIHKTKWNPYVTIYGETTDRVKYTDVVLAVSNSFYGNVPCYFRWKINKHINSKNPRRAKYEHEFAGGYKDHNPCELFDRPNKYSKPSKKKDQIAPKETDITIDSVLLYNKRHAIWSKPQYDMYENYWGRRVRITNNRYNMGPKILYTVINNKITSKTITKLEDLRMKFYQWRNLIIKRPKLLNRPEIAKFISDKGPEYELVVKKYQK